MQCGECDAKFSSVDALNAHMKTCHPKRLEYSVCQNCNKAFTGHRSLARHCKTCVGEIKCKLCGQFFWLEMRPHSSFSEVLSLTGML